MPLVTAMSLQPGSPSLTVLQAASSAQTFAALLSAVASNSTLNRFMASLLFSSVLGAAVSKGSYLRETGAALQIVEVDVVAHVLLAGVDPGLVRPEERRVGKEGGDG